MDDINLASQVSEQQPWTCNGCGQGFEADSRDDNPECPHCRKKQQQS
jgi:DNA-directed RNA polymerase subunit RPC12/RpoP